MKISHFGSGIAFLTLTFGASAANAQPNTAPQNMVARPKPLRVRATEPSKQILQDLSDFAEAINAGAVYPGGQRWIYGARSGFFGANEWARETDFTQMGRAGVAMKILGLSVGKIEGESANATVIYNFSAPNDMPAPGKELLTRERTESLQLKLGPIFPNQDRIWQIVPPDVAPQNLQTSAFEKQFDFFHNQERIWQVAPPDAVAQNLQTIDDLWATISFALAQNPNLKITDTKAKLSVRQMKQLNLGVMQFLQDYDERYAFAPQYLQEALLPYLKSKEVFFLPDSRETYSFNANLSDKSFAQISQPSKTVMFYEGSDEKPTFRYDGKAAILFVNGHVKLISPEEAKDLIWKP